MKINYNHIKSFIANCSENEVSSQSEIYVFDCRINNETFEITSCRPQYAEEWHHILVRPNLYKTPSYEVMAQISAAFFKNDEEFSMQVIPKRCNYVSNEEYTLHLWDMKSHCDFNFKDVYNYIFYQNDFDFKNDICVKHCTDTAHHKCIAVISENRWPTWEEIVQAKEEFMGTNLDAVIINRNISQDLKHFELSNYKIVLIWDASSIKLPDKNLV